MLYYNKCLFTSSWNFLRETECWNTKTWLLTHVFRNRSPTSEPVGALVPSTSMSTGPYRSTDIQQLFLILLQSKIIKCEVLLQVKAHELLICKDGNILCTFGCKIKDTLQFFFW